MLADAQTPQLAEEMEVLVGTLIVLIDDLTQVKVGYVNESHL